MPQKTDFFSGITHTGKVRDNNEDAFLVERILDDRYILACVIDGVGGYEGGEVAARIARDSILNHLQKPSEDLFLAIREAIIIANEKIYAEKISTDRNTRMACVLTIAVIDLTYNQFYYAHVGDTRLYLLRDYTLVKITRDDSFVGFLEDSKRLSEEEAMKHPKRNEINKALGFDPNIGMISDYIETGISPFLPGDILLLCSDGLTDMIDSKTITGVLTSRHKIAEKAKTLIDAANNAGGKDNVTVVLVHNSNKRTILEATKPPVVKKNDLPTENGNPEDPENGSPRQRKGTSPGVTIALLILCLGLIAALFWQISKSKKEPPAQATTPAKSKTNAELQLQENIRNTSVIIMNDSIYPEPVVITDTILIDQDSALIIGNNLVLQSDTKAKSAAFLIAPDCKYVLFENITFKNFERAIITQNRVVHLKNVRFVDCDISLEYNYIFPQNIYVNGSIMDTVSFKTDSVTR